MKRSPQLVAAEERRRNARLYIYFVKPALLLVVTALTLFAWLGDPDTIPPALWAVNATFLLIQAFWIVLVRTGRNPLTIAGISFVVDAALEFSALYSSPAPVGSSSTLSFFIVAAAYFLPAAATVTFSTACTVAIVVASNQIERWDEPFAFPTTAFLAFVIGPLAAFIMSRVRRTEQRLHEAVVEQVAARESIEQLGRVRDRLIANVSHELRTPLTSTIGFIETILREDIELSDDERRTLTLHARDGGHRLLALVEDLLTLGSTRPDSLSLEPDEVQVEQLVREAVAALPPAQDRSILIEVDSGCPKARVDRARIIQVITNLVVNAERHGEGRIDVRCAELPTGGARIEVIDEGRGVAPEHVGELFLPFARFSDRPDSTGLGLAICRAIVEAHGGSIGYDRTAEERSRFWVDLPAVAAH